MSGDPSISGDRVLVTGDLGFVGAAVTTRIDVLEQPVADGVAVQ
jgi:hypothetical protein